MTINQIASAILNDLWGGNLIPSSNRSLISIEQLEDEIIEERASIIKDWYLHGNLIGHDLALSINCIPVNCADINKCPCKSIPGKMVQHFEIPQLADGLGDGAIIYIGSIDKEFSYRVYYNLESIKFQKYRKRGNVNQPYVYIEKAPNNNGMYDCWLFNAPMAKYISVIGIFKDPRQLEGFGCCESNTYLDLGTVSAEIIRRILAKKAQLYRAYVPPVTQTTA